MDAQSHRHNSASTKLATKTCLESQIQVHSGSEAATYKITTSWPNKLNESSSVPAATTCVKGCTCSIPVCIEQVVFFIIIIILIRLPGCCNTNRNVVLGCTVLCIESSSPEEEDNENVVDVLMLALCIYVSGSNDMCRIKPIKLGILLQTCKTGTHATCHILQQQCVTFLFSPPYYMQICWTASSPLSPLLSQGLMYFYDSILLLRSHLATSCPVQYLSGVAI